MTVHDDERGPVRSFLKCFERSLQHFLIIGITDAGHIPTVADKTGSDVVAERPRRVAFNSDLVVVIDPAKVGKLEMSRERGRFARDSLHHAAVSAKRVDVVIE